MKFYKFRKEEIEMKRGEIEKHYTGGKAISGTKSYHSYVPISATSFNCRIYSLSQEFTLHHVFTPVGGHQQSSAKEDFEGGSFKDTSVLALSNAKLHLN